LADKAPLTGSEVHAAEQVGELAHRGLLDALLAGLGRRRLGRVLLADALVARADVVEEVGEGELVQAVVLGEVVLDGQDLQEAEPILAEQAGVRLLTRP
jgi:hypothetical protein